MFDPVLGIKRGGQYIEVQGPTDTRTHVGGGFNRYATLDSASHSPFSDCHDPGPNLLRLRGVAARAMK